MAVRKSATDTT